VVLPPSTSEAEVALPQSTLQALAADHKTELWRRLSSQFDFVYTGRVTAMMIVYIAVRVLGDDLSIS